MNVGESSRDCTSHRARVSCSSAPAREATLPELERGVLLVACRSPVARGMGMSSVPNHFLDSLALPSMTSKTPDLSDSTEGTWLARLLLAARGELGFEGRRGSAGSPGGEDAHCSSFGSSCMSPCYPPAPREANAPSSASCSLQSLRAPHQTIGPSTYMPMSPEVAAMLTWTTSEEEKMVCRTSEGVG